MDDVNSQNVSAQPAQSTQPQSSSTDFSKTTIIVLVVLTLVISAVSTWTVWNAITDAKLSQGSPAASSGEVRLNIISPNDLQSEANIPVGATGQVVLKYNGNK